MRDTRDACASYEIPQVFCWTKMGAEAGQDLRSILRRKELERQSGDGTFSWGIGTAVGSALDKARSCSGEVQALFTPMKSSAKRCDISPRDVVLWLSYYSANREVVPLPKHMLVTSRQRAPSGAEKRFHYALLCRRKDSLESSPEGSSIDSRLARNFSSELPVGASQVTAIVKYAPRHHAPMGGVYHVQFRATLVDEGVVKLAMPVRIVGDLARLYERLIGVSDERGWTSRVSELKQMAMTQIKNSPQQSALFV